MKLTELLDRRGLSQVEVKADPQRPSTTAVGIEVEIENMPTRQMMREEFDLWSVTSEGSIQQGCEFVSRPIWGTQITAALGELQAVFDKHRPYVSFRTSVHVHVNCLDIDSDALERLVLLYLLYEPALFRLHQNWSRYDNIFCVPARKSIDIQMGYARLLYQIEMGMANGKWVPYKYAALNPNSLTQFGTLEFRHMGGTTDMDDISKWVNILMCLKEAAVNDVQPRNVPRLIFGELTNQMVFNDQDIESGLDLEDYILTLKETM